MIAYTFMDAYQDLSLGNQLENRIIYSKDTVARNIDRDEEIKKIRDYAILLMSRVLILDEMRSHKSTDTYKTTYRELVKIFNDTFRILKISKFFSSSIDYVFSKDDMRVLREVLEGLLGEELRSCFPYHKLKEINVTIKYKLYLQLLDNTLFGDITRSNVKPIFIQDLLDRFDSLFTKL